MKLQNFMIIVDDIDKSVEFYNRVMGLDVALDFGANKTLTGGLVLQTKETYTDFIDNKYITFGGNDTEIYFEEDDLDDFLEKISAFDIDYVHPAKEHTWGQRVVRFYDPDMHIIEVGESLNSVCKRFKKSGMTVEQIAKRMDVPIDFVKSCIE